MKRLTGAWLDDPALGRVIGVLTDAGGAAHVVGGAVRNALLGLPIGDVDIATSLEPDAVIAAAEAAGIRALPTGLAHGTVTLVCGAAAFEVTSFRRDTGTDGRHARVVFSSDIREDALRRDFTMNALYCDPEGSVIDPLGGMADVEARRLRFVGTAADRIREDYLRILRFFRMHAWYADPAGGFEAEALAAIADNLDGLSRLSPERTGAEMLRLLAAPDPAPALAAMQACGVLHRVLPGADAMAVARLVAAEADREARPIRRLVALVGAAADAPVEALRLSRQQAGEFTRLAGLAVSDEPIPAIAWRHGAATGIDAALIRATLVGHAPPEQLDESCEWAAAQVMPVTAADLMPALSGPALGAALRRAEAAWIASGFSAGRDRLIALALSGGPTRA